MSVQNFLCQSLTEELIRDIDDPAKLREHFISFYRKAQALEKEFESYQNDQLKKLQEAQTECMLFKESIQDIYKKVEQSLEQDFSCTICNEVYIEPAVLDCSHTFCTHCIQKWKDGGNRDCPNCRKVSIKPLVKHSGMESLISKIISPEMQAQRDQLIRDRRESSVRGIPSEESLPVVRSSDQTPSTSSSTIRGRSEAAAADEADANFERSYGIIHHMMPSSGTRRPDTGRMSFILPSLETMREQNDYGNMLRARFATVPAGSEVPTNPSRGRTRNTARRGRPSQSARARRRGGDDVGHHPRRRFYWSASDNEEINNSEQS